MYRMNRQMRIEDFMFPYGQLDKDNEWVKLADLVPWDEAEEAYARLVVNNGHPQDFREAREKLEHVVDVYCEAYKLIKPRMRRRTPVLGQANRPRESPCEHRIWSQAAYQPGG